MRREPRADFQRDRDRIIQSKAFRRLTHKTQVFIAPEGDHYRTRLTHTLEVAQVSRAIARAIGLNEDLTEAIALGHDLGHTPFGHTGEAVLNTLMLPLGGFRHNEQSGRVVRVLENDGAGLGLSDEVVDGIVNHRSSGNPMTPEGQTVRLSDKIAYINHDIDDAVRAGVLDPDDLPREARLLGESPGERIDNLIRAAVSESAGRDTIALPDESRELLWALRAFMFRTVYASQIQAAERMKIKGIIVSLWDLYARRPELLPEAFRQRAEPGGGLGRSACDYIAGMTDRFAMRVYLDNFVPESWKLSI
ncbi:MAG: deoxyguanosinetriphosphate triphosphohydrolase [Clostridiales bacterium]|jgi:dGTPase|nr:deoxyguanosinetriphosphate triphosphohydrolase [Clostridiales bacterium]